MYSIHIMLIFTTFFYLIFAKDDANRVKRALIVSPMGGTFKLVIGVALPVHIGSKQSMVYGLNFQFQYAQPQNATELKTYPPIISRNREKREQKFTDRAITYETLELLMNRYGINGRSCLLRSICDNAMHPLNSKENGVYGKLMHILLTPNYGNREFHSELNSIYLDALTAGKYGVDCISLYPACPYGHGILDVIATLTDI